MVLAGLNILLLAEYIGSGGTRTYAKDLLRFYARHGATVTLVGVYAEPDNEMQTLVKELGFSRLTYGEVVGQQASDKSQPPVWSMAGVLRERRLFREFLENGGYDKLVVTVGTPGMFAGASGASRDSLYILHTYPHGRRQRLLGGQYMSRLFPRSLRFITVSEFQRQVLLDRWRLHRSPWRVKCIRSTTGDLGPLRTTSDATPLTVLTVAGLVPYKQPLLWVDVAKTVLHRFPRGGVRFVWVGEGPMLDEAIVRAEEFVSEGHIQFAGLQSDVSSYYQSAHVYLQLSTIETLGLAVLDAQRFGLPSVVSRVGGLPEVVSDAETGLLVDPRDSQATSDALTHLLQAPSERARMSVAARSRYSRLFNPQRWEQEMLEVHGGRQTTGEHTISCEG